ncbi:glutathione S-transferase C-terminal domain-containing protein isoform X1 [Petromyzon marinus]|uniref:glutathione S-transferase C-terminal domain-containing protein isoform X1 n=1 Tax=Petromyzon marinus TaxID=7757 RepID=UPI003F6F4482
MGTQEELSHLYLEYTGTASGTVTPLQTAITLFLLSYCQDVAVKVHLVSEEEGAAIDDTPTWAPPGLHVTSIRRSDLPPIVQRCLLPALIDDASDGAGGPQGAARVGPTEGECGLPGVPNCAASGDGSAGPGKRAGPPASERPGAELCRAGLAVVLRFLVQRAARRRAVLLQLLGFRQTCLKACAEVSQWTRLCEVTFPAAVQSLVNAVRSSPQPPCHRSSLPQEVLELERRLGEPVRVHNDDKLRRVKLRGRQQKQQREQQQQQEQREQREQQQQQQEAAMCGDAGQESTVELAAALARLACVGSGAGPGREAPSVRRVVTAQLPALEHVFAEGLYFTLTDLVLFPCVHLLLAQLLSSGQAEVLLAVPLVTAWYGRVSAVPAVRQAAAGAGLQPLDLPPTHATPLPSSASPGPARAVDPEALGSDKAAPPVAADNSRTASASLEQHFKGGPRPTLAKLKEAGIEACLDPHPCCQITLPWGDYPAAVNPEEGQLSEARALRKRQQLENLVGCVRSLAQPSHVIVDFCSGGGHLGIVLAYLLPQCQVVLVENKEQSLERAQSRCRGLGLSNVSLYQCNLDYYQGAFDIGVALHACGVATDMVLERCVRARAAFVVSPCCYGFIQNTDKVSFPKRRATPACERRCLCVRSRAHAGEHRSQMFQEVLSYREHMVLCRFADQTAQHLSADRRSTGKACMTLVDQDRAAAAAESGFHAHVHSMNPETCSPKNSILVGVLDARFLADTTTSPPLLLSHSVRCTSSELGPP